MAVARGKYAIYTIPGEESWTVVLNRSTRQWGLTRPEVGSSGVMFQSAYSPLVQAAEVGRRLVEAREIPHVERLTARAEVVSPTRTVLLLEWETTQIRIPVETTEGPSKNAA